MNSTVACPNCHEPIIPGAQFCPRCGNDVSGPQGILTTAQVHPRGSSPKYVGAELRELLREATLGEYDILGELGRGGMAVVYLAHDIALDRKVAIKVMNPSLLMGAGMTERFKREARIAAALTHPHIIPIHLVRETERLLFFVMKYVEGRSLDSIIAETGPLPINMVHTILAAVGSALAYAHRRGVVHRDIKPANILIDSEGWVVVTDFGIAKVAEAGNLTVSGTTVGTPSYMSPEQCSARPVTGASDQYSLGIVAFEMIAGRAPFAGDSLMEIMRMHFFEPPPPLASARSDCPPALTAAIERMLSKEPRQRWPSIEEAISAAGGAVAPRDDEVRTHMIELAKAGIKSIARLPTPTSPPPVGRPSGSEGVGPAHATRKPSPTLPKGRAPARRESPTSRPPWRRRVLLWGMVAVAISSVGLAGYVFLVGWQGSAKGGGGGPPDSVAAINITGTPGTMAAGDQVRLTATAQNTAGHTVSSAPIRWSTSDTAVVAVTADGVVRAVTPGDATIEAASGNQRQSVRISVRSVPITITQAAVTFIDITPPAPSVMVKRSIQLTAATRDSRGTILSERRIAWSSEDAAVVAVSQSGLVTGIAPGIALVQAISEGIHSRVKVTVTLPTPATVIVSPSAPTVSVQDSVQLLAAAKDSSGQSFSGYRFGWSSSDPGIASVSTNGMVTGLTAGAVRITARTESGTSGTATVTVFRSGAVLQLMIAEGWANVSIDGQPLGQGTQFQRTLPAGVPHTLRIERDGFETIDSTITLKPGEQRQLRVQLTRTPSSLRILVQPWANVLIDGQNVGQHEQLQYPVSSGIAHHVRLERSGFVTKDTTVTLGPSELRVLQFQLIRRPP